MYVNSSSSAVDLWFELRSGHYLTICDSHAASRSKSKDCLDRIKIMYPSGATCLPANCCWSELALWKPN